MPAAELRIAGHRNGYWDDDAAVVAEVAATSPDLLFLAIPSPRKEFWLAEHMPALGVPFAMGVGGSFDILSGITRRAPPRLQRLGLEWLYRVYQEPGRMWWRYAKTNTLFASILLQAVIRRSLGVPPRASGPRAGQVGG